MSKSTIVLLVLLLALGAVAIFILPGDEERSSSYSAPAISFKVDSGSIAKIDISRPGSRVTIESIGGRWTITQPGSYLADPVSVTQLIGSFANFRPGSLISANPEKQSLFQVDSSGTIVTLSDRGGTSSQIIIGKMGPSFSEVYFRLPGASEVYLGSGITTWTLNKEVKDWRDKTILQAATEGVRSVTITTGARTRSYSKDSTGWKSGGETVDNQTMNPILTTIGNLRADDFIDSLMTLTTVPGVVDVRGEVNATLQFQRMPADTNKYVVQSSNSPQRFVVGKYIASRLFTDVGEPPSSSSGSRRAAERSAAPSQPASRPPSGDAAKAPATEPAKEPVVTPPAVKEETPPPPPPSGAGDKGAVNPFKQRPAGETRPQTDDAPAKTPPVRTTPPAGGSSSGQSGQSGGGTSGQSGSGSTTPTPGGSTSGQSGGGASAQSSPTGAAKSGGSVEEEGELTIHVVKQAETMTMIANQYGVSVDQIIKWNLLKSISVKPGQELYIFVRK